MINQPMIVEHVDRFICANNDDMQITASRPTCNNNDASIRARALLQIRSMILDCSCRHLLFLLGAFNVFRHGPNVIQTLAPDGERRNATLHAIDRLSQRC